MKVIISPFELVSDDSLVVNGLVIKDIEHGVTLAGGVSTFQYLTFTVITSGMLSGAFFLYSLPYFEKLPALECLYEGTTDYVYCNQTEACNTPGVLF